MTVLGDDVNLGEHQVINYVKDFACIILDVLKIWNIWYQFCWCYFAACVQHSGWKSSLLNISNVSWLIYLKPWTLLILSLQAWKIWSLQALPPAFSLFLGGGGALWVHIDFLFLFFSKHTRCMCIKNIF